MGNYAATTDLDARFDDDAERAALTDNEETGTANDAVSNEVINDSEGEIDAALAMRYFVPVAVTDTVTAARMKSVTLDLAVWRLHVRQGSVPPAVETQATLVRDWLELVAKGERVLPQPETADSTTSREPSIAFGTAATGASSRRIFTRATQDNI